MDKSFYKKEAESLQGLFEKFSAIQFDADPNKLKDLGQSKEMVVVVVVLFLLVISMVGFLTVWLIN